MVGFFKLPPIALERRFWSSGDRQSFVLALWKIGAVVMPHMGKAGGFVFWE